MVRSPAYATAGGRVKYGARRLREEDEVELQVPEDVPVMQSASLGGRIGAWFREVF